MSEDTFGLRPIWDAILGIYDEFASLCERHGLRYYVTDGALLGAVRHGGFIPWDDDLDISMPREDYDRFVELTKSELPPHLKFVNWRNTPEFTLLFGKIQDVREERIRQIEDQTGRILSNGLYIDILPIDGYPPKGIRSWFVALRDNFLLLVERFHLYRYSHLSRKGKHGWMLGMLCSIFVPWMWSQRQFLSLHEKSIRKYPFAGAQEVGRACQRMNVFRRVPMSAGVWGKPVPHPFDGRTIMVPADIDAYLKNEYGDYMKLPPESARHPGHSYAWRCAWWRGPTTQESPN